MSNMKPSIFLIIGCVLTSVADCRSTALRDTCGDGICSSPEFAESCPTDCGNIIQNPYLLRGLNSSLIAWFVRPNHLVTHFVSHEGRNVTELVPGMVLHQPGLRVKEGTSYQIEVDSSSNCTETFVHSDTEILWMGTPGGVWTPRAGTSAVVEMTIRASCQSNISGVSIKPVPTSQDIGWKYYDIVDSILYDPVRVDSSPCRARCLADLNCCAWQVCPGSEAEGCGGCYLLGRRPHESSAEIKLGWTAAIERSRPEAPLGVEECRLYLLSQSAHEKDFYDTASGKLQRYVHCANVVRGDRTVPKQIFMGGVHIPTILVANHRNPDPRLNGGTSILPHFYILPFYDTNIGNIMKHTSAMNIVQSYEMQSILRPGEVFVDVGANLGSYTLALAEHVGPNGIVIAFEPFRWLFQILNANIAANGLMNCWTYQIGLGEIASRESLLQPNLRFFSSPGGVRVESQLKNMSLETQKQMYDHEWGLESVDIWRLDDIVFEGSMFRSARAPQVDLIKIDVEGMEVPVIKGALKTLDQLKPVVWVESVGYFESGDLTLVHLLDSAGYVCWKSLSAGNDLICEPKDGSRSDRLNRVRKQPLGESSPQVCSL